MHKGEMLGMIKVLVNGALGRMGHTVVQTVLQQKDMELVGAVDKFGKDKPWKAARWIRTWSGPWKPASPMWWWILPGPMWSWTTCGSS